MATAIDDQIIDDGEIIVGYDDAGKELTVSILADRLTQLDIFDIVEDSAGNLIVGEGNLGFIKILTADNTVDRTFAAGNRNFRGSAAA